VRVARDGIAGAEHRRALTTARARAIGDAAFGRVMAEHTYGHRAAELEAIFATRRMIPRDASRPSPLDAAIVNDVVEARA